MMTNRFTTLNATVIALFAATGLAIKPVISPIAKSITSLFLLPGGAVAGAIYLIWPLLALLLLNKRGSAILVGLLQALTVLVTGIYGSHGILSIFTYTLPCVIIELTYWGSRKINQKFACMISAASGNVCANFMVGYFLSHLPMIPLLLGLIPAFIFGSLAGPIALSLQNSIATVFPALSGNSFNNRPTKDEKA